MPTILALDCSSEYCSVAVWSSDRQCEREVLAGQTHSARLLPMVKDILDQAGASLHTCDAIAFGAGPGSFTGLRIACATAQGLALGAGRPLLAIGTLTAMAEESLSEDARRDTPGVRILSAQDARKGELYWTILEYKAGLWLECVPPSLSAPEELDALIPEPIALGCGNAFTIFGDSVGRHVRELLPTTHASAAAIARLGRDAFARGQGVPPGLAHPLYVRDRVASTAAERAALLDT